MLNNSMKREAFLITFVILLTISGVYEIYFQDASKGLITTGLAFAILFGLYRDYFTGVLGFISGLMLLFSVLLLTPIGTIFFSGGLVYVFIKEWRWKTI